MAFDIAFGQMPGRPAATRRVIALAVLSAAAAGCSSLGHPRCLGGQQAAIQDMLYFGTETPSGQVTPDDWANFLGETVTPRVPQGLTAWEASGQWRSASGDIVREPSYVLSVVHPAGASHASAIREIVVAYQARFQQEAVLQVSSNVCMGF